MDCWGLHTLVGLCLWSPSISPDVMFQLKNVFLSLIIPRHLGNKMGVFMEPLIDESILAWEKGVLTYDQATKKNFIMHGGTTTPCMTSWCMAYSMCGVFTGSSHAQYARQLWDLVGWRGVVSFLCSTNIVNSSILTMHLGETLRTLGKGFKSLTRYLRWWLVLRSVLR